MKSKLGYAPAEAAFPFGGMDTNTPASQLAPGETPGCVNATTFRGSILKRTGYIQLGSALGSAESVLRLYNFQLSNGTNILVAWTLSKVYGYSQGFWSDLTPNSDVVTLPKESAGDGWTLTGIIPVGTFVIQAGTDAVGQWLTPDTSNYYISVTTGAFDTMGNVGAVASVGSTGVVTSSGTTTADVSTVITTFHSSEDTFIDVTEGVDVNLGRIMIFTNGVDQPYYWDGVAPTLSILQPNLDGFLTAKTVAVFHEYLIFANIQTITDFEPRTAAWSDTGDFGEWLAGNAGILAEMDFDGAILRLIPYAQNLIVFSERTIGCLCYIDPTVIFGTQIYVTDIKVVGPKAICNANPFLIYAGQDNLYIWDGSRVVSTVGDKIATLWRSAANKVYLNRTELFYDPAKSQVYWIIPTGATTSRLLNSEMALTTFTFADAEKSQKTRWYEWILTDRPLGFWTYEDQTLSNYETVVFGSTDGNVFSQNGVLTDNGATITLQWQTPDLTVPQIFQSQFARWLELEFEALGTGVIVEYSIDSGTSWTALPATALSTARLAYKVYYDTTARFIRFRFNSSDTLTQFELSWYRAWLRPGGAR